MNLGKVKGRREMEGYEYGNVGAESVGISSGRKREGVLAALRAGRKSEK